VDFQALLAEKAGELDLARAIQSGRSPMLTETLLVGPFPFDSHLGKVSIETRPDFLKLHLEPFQPSPGKDRESFRALEYTNKSVNTAIPQVHLGINVLFHFVSISFGANVLHPGPRTRAKTNWRREFLHAEGGGLARGSENSTTGKS
jgi:hypothetical protein